MDYGLLKNKKKYKLLVEWLEKDGMFRFEGRQFYDALALEPLLLSLRLVAT